MLFIQRAYVLLRANSILSRYPLTWQLLHRSVNGKCVITCMAKRFEIYSCNISPWQPEYELMVKLEFYGYFFQVLLEYFFPVLSAACQTDGGNNIYQRCYRGNWSNLNVKFYYLSDGLNREKMVVRLLLIYANVFILSPFLTQPIRLQMTLVTLEDWAKH